MTTMNWEKIKANTNRARVITWRKSDIKASGVMPYGKYKGYAISDLPQEYLEWAIKSMSSHRGLINDLDREWLRRYNK